MHSAFCLFYLFRNTAIVASGICLDYIQYAGSKAEIRFVPAGQSLRYRQKLKRQ